MRVVVKRGDGEDSSEKDEKNDMKETDVAGQQAAGDATPSAFVIDDSEKEVFDAEEAALMEQSVREEMRTLTAMKSKADLIHTPGTPQPAPGAAAKEEPGLIPWPDALEDKALVENALFWPDLSTSGPEVEEWVVSNTKIMLRTVTWNLAAKPPPAVDAATSVMLPRNRYHIYVVGTEECERSIAQSALNPSKKAWEAYLGAAIGDMYVPLRSHTLQAIHLIVFVHKGIAHLCSEITSGAIATGFGGNLGNKGAVAVNLRVGDTTLTIVNAHLSAHQNAVKDRNAEFNKVDNEMPALLKKNRSASAPLKSGSSSTKSVLQIAPADASVKTDGASEAPEQTGWRQMTFSSSEKNSLSASADRVIFMGDLNYRIRGNRSMIDALLEHDMHDVLTHNDQLKWSLNQKLVGTAFIEPPLNFRPTYKYDFQSDVYDSSSKARIPSWTDRILHVPKGLQCLAYNADNSVRTSDHRPVYATFVVELAFHAEHEVATPSKPRDHPEFSSESQVCVIS